MIGIDIISTARFKKISANDYEYWSKFFSQDEWEYAFAKADSAAALAGIYAAKEAVMKAASGDLLGRADRISVVHLPAGKPVIKIDKQPQPSIVISISHDAGLAVAVAYER